MSELFEIHITADETIHEAAKLLGLKTIEIELLNPQMNVIGRESMTSHILQARDFKECKIKVDEIVRCLTPCNISRVKIESPYYPKYLDAAIYLESHFPALFSFGQIVLNWPVSRNVGSNKFIQTTRTFDRKAFTLFKQYCTIESIETEMCLYDTNVKQDDLWFGIWGVPNGTVKK